MFFYAMSSLHPPASYWLYTSRMRDKWNRSSEQLRLTHEAIETLLLPCFPQVRVSSSSLVEGGLANTNIRAFLNDGSESVLLKLFVRDPSQAAKEFRLSQLPQLQGVMPKYFFFAPDNSITGHPYIIMEWIAGERLELMLPIILSTIEKSAKLADELGGALAHIHSIRFAQTGFFDQELCLVSPVELGVSGLQGYAQQCLSEGLGLSRLGAEFVDRFLHFVNDNGALLNEWPGGACLTHGDFGGSNILVNEIKIAAVIDWEFAFSGYPAFDFGNLLRADMGAQFEDRLASAYRDAGGLLPADWRSRSLMADLYSWLDFLNRPQSGDALIADARRIMSDTMTRLAAR